MSSDVQFRMTVVLLPISWFSTFLTRVQAGQPISGILFPLSHAFIMFTECSFHYFVLFSSVLKNVPGKDHIVPPISLFSTSAGLLKQETRL